jgi:hypothetical protein
MDSREESRHRKSPDLDYQMEFVRWLLLIIHALLGAVLLGGTFYSVMIVQPRAKSFFKNLGDFEGFVANLAHGARWQFLPLLLVIAITGLIDPFLSTSPHSFLWWICFALKSALWAITVGCFVYVSWYLWPRRVLAATTEVSAIQREFARVGRTILALLLLSFVIGLAMHRLQ